MDEQKNSISGFYRGRSIFITGATGFVGKVLVEKLLRSCPEIKTVYLLLRKKKGMETKQRLEHFLKDKIFEKVKSEQPSALSKLVVIEGSLDSPGLGINEFDLKLLQENASVVFHSAATVRFKEPLKKAMDLNVLGTRRLIQLCHKMKKLEVLIHVSTAYCNCDRKVIEEKIYELPAPPKRIIDTIELLNEEEIETLTPHILRSKPNTYTYTKALAETLLVEECGGSFPVAIVRPSIVSAAWKEPFPGWIDNYNGATGLIVAIGKGILRSMHINLSSVADIIPVDIVINLMIAVSWYTATHKPQDIKVYNCTSGSINSITWGSLRGLMYSMLIRYPSCEIFRYPRISFKSSKVFHSLSVTLHHYVPAYTLDMVSSLIGRKPKFVSQYKKLDRSMKELDYFVTRDWSFSCDNVLMLEDNLSTEDNKVFNFNIKSLHWPSYLEDYILGIRQFLLNEEESSLPKARKKLRRIFLYTKLIKLAITIVILMMVLMLYNAA